MPDSSMNLDYKNKLQALKIGIKNDLQLTYQ